VPLTGAGPVESAFRAHGGSVHAAAQSVLRDPHRAQDVVQDVFLRVWRHPERFDPARGDLGPYLRLLARSRAIDLLREAKSRQRAIDRLEGVVERREVPPEGLPEATLDRLQQADTLRAALRKLPPTQRRALVLAYWGGLSVDEVARQTGSPLGTAKGRIRLGLAKLRQECGTALRPAV
jgi:RNA polymerase sigma-70 factor (ECF subfamily)